MVSSKKRLVFHAILTKTLSTHPKILIRLLALFCLTFPAVSNAEELLFADDFQNGEISDEWVFYGDPTSIINQNRGNPAPCFCNNGDSMYGSGIFTRESFSIENGLVVECDFFVNSHPRGAWIDARFQVCDINQIIPGHEPPTFVGISYSFYGELDWSAPHLQGVVGQLIAGENIPTLVHMNQWLNGWFTYKIEITPEGFCSLFMNDSLLGVYQPACLNGVEQVVVILGGRSSSWGIALHDNLRVYVP